MGVSQACYCIGQIVHHKLFDYRGVIIDVDPKFCGTQQWYDTMARSRPPKDLPWYHVLVHNSAQQTYVAERNLELIPEPNPISHPLLSSCFGAFENGAYVPHRPKH